MDSFPRKTYRLTGGTWRDAHNWGNANQKNNEIALHTCEMIVLKKK